MLKYNVKLGNKNFKQSELVWREKYLSPDLSYITGVTSPSYNLDSFKYVYSKNSFSRSDGVLSIEAHNEKRMGYVVAEGKKYYVHSGVTSDFSTNSKIEYKYVFINGKYFYCDSNSKTFTIDNILYYKDNDIKDAENEALVVDYQDNGYIEIDRVYYIDDNKVIIDDEEYLYDRWEDNNGILKYLDDGRALESEEITDCANISCHPYQIEKIEEITKFILRKSDNIVEKFNGISFCKYYYYIKYKNHYCNVLKEVNLETNRYSFYCEIPKYLLGNDDDSGDYYQRFDLYFTNDSGDGDITSNYEESYRNGDKLDSEHYDAHGIKTMDELFNKVPFIYIEDENIFLGVDRELVSSNDGVMLSVDLEDTYANFKLYDKFNLIGDNDEINEVEVYEDVFGVNNKQYFVYFNNNKYYVVKNLCDKADIDGVECDIEYINGRVANVDCIVLINDEYVPMKLIEQEGQLSLKKYGKVMLSDSISSTTEAIYDIKEYSGVTINDTKCIVRELGGNGIYARIPFAVQYKLQIIDIVGNSLYICKPFFNYGEFSTDFIRMMQENICKDVVENQNKLSLFSKNNIFGEQELSETLAFTVATNPKSSSDFYNLFKDLTIYVDSGYIHIPLSLCSKVGGNPIQDNIVKNKFFDAKKSEVINGIVDMEKDVYVPKYMNGEYSGSTTEFMPIYEMVFNFHFRTRDKYFKINDESNGWFITDYYPYKCMDGESLQSASDLMGLIGFTDDDIFYQKSNVAKSFMRLSFYDSINPNTQSLLATSCVFVDEHALFKTFIDNSRQNINDYVECSSSAKCEDETCEEEEACESGTLKKRNKISSITEYGGEKNQEDNSRDYKLSDNSVVISESNRISSRLTVKNKYSTDTSSEGFYLYIFKEYSENLHPKPIYMKVEFNHAGIGKTIPFTIPMHWSGNTSDSASTDYNVMRPVRSLNLSNDDDREELLSGTPLSYMYAQTYIPLYAVYDFVNKEYCYVFDNRYVTPKDGILEFNLFELKAMREDNRDASELEKIREDMLIGKPNRAVINVNTEQFKKEYFR